MGLFGYLHKRQIPNSGRGVFRKPCPSPALESVPVATSDPGPNAAAQKLPWGAGLLRAPPAPYGAQAASPRGWWNKSRQPRQLVLYDDDYLALPGTTSPSPSPSPSQAPEFALGSFMRQPSQTNAGAPQPFALGSYAKLAPQSSSDAPPQQPPSFCLLKEDGTCKTFFRKKPFVAQDTSLPRSSCGRGLSSYSSRLLSDNRVWGSSRWGKEAREAFFRPYETSFIDTHCHLDFLFSRQPYSWVVVLKIVCVCVRARTRLLVFVHVCAQMVVCLYICVCVSVLLFFDFSQIYISVDMFCKMVSKLTKAKF